MPETAVVATRTSRNSTGTLQKTDSIDDDRPQTKIDNYFATVKTADFLPTLHAFSRISSSSPKTGSDTSSSIAKYTPPAFLAATTTSRPASATTGPLRRTPSSTLNRPRSAAAILRSPSPADDSIKSSSSPVSAEDRRQGKIIYDALERTAEAWTRASSPFTVSSKRMEEDKKAIERAVIDLKNVVEATCPESRGHDEVWQKQIEEIKAEIDEEKKSSSTSIQKKKKQGGGAWQPSALSKVQTMEAQFAAMSKQLQVIEKMLAKTDL